MIPANTTNIGQHAFEFCFALSKIVVPASVATLGSYAFSYCYELTNVFFQGSAPADDGSMFFDSGGAYNVTIPPVVYYQLQTGGWGSSFGSYPTVAWDPVIRTTNWVDGFGPGWFLFSITSTNNIPVVLEASTELRGGTWIPLWTNTISNGVLNSIDPFWIYQNRFYRVRFP